MVAKFYSKCPKCGAPIEVGSDIVKDTASGKYVHSVCPGDPIAPTPNAAALNPIVEAAKDDTLLARFKSRCNICREDIEPGQVIKRPRGQRAYAHLDCASSPDNSKLDMRSGPDEDEAIERDVDAALEAAREREDDFEF